MGHFAFIGDRCERLTALSPWTLTKNWPEETANIQKALYAPLHWQCALWTASLTVAHHANHLGTWTTTPTTELEINRIAALAPQVGAGRGGSAWEQSRQNPTRWTPSTQDKTETWVQAAQAILPKGLVVFECAASTERFALYPGLRKKMAKANHLLDALEEWIASDHFVLFQNERNQWAKPVLVRVVQWWGVRQARPWDKSMVQHGCTAVPDCTMFALWEDCRSPWGNTPHSAWV